MKRIPTIAATAILLMMLAAWPAQAQYGGGGGGGNPISRPAGVDGEIVQTTPCSTIVVQGTGWGPSTTIYIDREFGNADCPGTGSPRDVRNDGEDDTRAAGPSEVVVAEDGTFVAELLVPADAVGDYEVEVTGTGLDGTAKQQTYSFDVDPTANFVTDATAGTTANGDNTATMALAAVLAALILAVGFNWPSLVARVRR